MITLIAFAVFAALSLAKAWSGETSCGCLGPVTVNPWLMLGLDVAILAALAMCRRSREAKPAAGSRGRAASLC